MMDVVGILGAGTMGAQVAEVAAEAGMRVVLVDVADGALKAARQSVRDSLRARQLTDGKKRDTALVLSRIETTLDVGPLAECSVIVENATEDLKVKQALWSAMDERCPKAEFVAANTSCFPIETLGGYTLRPERVVGIHLMNPVALRPVVEVIRGAHTSPEALSKALDWLARLGKRAVVVGDGPGFVSNRVLMPMVNEAAGLVLRGVASAANVDRVFRECMSHRMGPLETADLIGLDTVVRSLEALRDLTGEARFEPCPLLRELLAKGHLGRKSGRGFYEYEELL